MTLRGSARCISRRAGVPTWLGGGSAQRERRLSNSGEQTSLPYRLRTTRGDGLRGGAARDALRRQRERVCARPGGGSRQLAALQTTQPRRDAVQGAPPYSWSSHPHLGLKAATPYGCDPGECDGELCPSGILRGCPIPSSPPRNPIPHVRRASSARCVQRGCEGTHLTIVRGASDRADTGGDGPRRGAVTRRGGERRHSGDGRVP